MISTFVWASSSVNGIRPSCSARSSLRDLYTLGFIFALLLGSDLIQADAIEEVVVTATKRGPTALQDVPISMQVLSSEELTNIRARNFEDWARLVPGLSFQDQGPGDKRYIIRGVQSAGAGTVGVYLNDAVITGSNGEDGGGRNPDIKLFDVDRVEVLKGPQGTLYGASSMSGTIRIITNQPKLDQFETKLESSISGTHGGGFNYEMAATANLPVVEDKFALRAVGWVVNNDGYIDNVQLGNKNINDEQTYGGRVTALWTPTTNLRVTASAMIQSMDIGDNSRWNEALGKFQADHFSRNPWEETASLYTATVEYNAGFGTFTGTTNWFDREIDGFRFDITRFLARFGLNIPSMVNEPQDRRIWSNELRFSSNFEGPFQVVTGLYYEDQERKFEVRSVRINANGDAIIPNGYGDPIIPEAFIQGRRASTKFKQYAFFGELSYDFTDRFQGLVGLRQFHSKQVEEGITTFPFGGFPPAGPPAADPVLEGTENKLTKKLTLSYKITEDINTFVLYSEGFRVGGLNDQAIGNFAVIPPEYGSDEIDNYELGLKTAWLDNRLIGNLSVYTINWRNMQSKQVDEVTRFPFVGNAGKAGIDGFELDLNASPADGLTIFVGLGYTDGKLTEDQPLIPNDPNTGRDGDRIPNVPKWTASSSVQYSFPISGGLSGFFRGDVLYRGSTATQFRLTNPAYLKLDPYTLLNLRGGIQSDTWSVNLFVENVFDKLAEQDKVLTTSGAISVFSVKPRTIGLYVQKNF